jgi:hypothetical protein
MSTTYGWLSGSHKLKRKSTMIMIFFKKYFKNIFAKNIKNKEIINI